MKPNWNDISRIYIEGEINESGDRVYPTLEELSQRFGFRNTTVRRHSSEEHWRDKRTAFQLEVEEQARQARIQKRIKEESDLHDSIFTISKGAIRHLALHLKNLIDEYNDWKANPFEMKGTKKIPKPSPLGKASISTLESLARTLERLQRTACVALGTPNQNVAISGPMNGPIEVNQHISSEELDRRIREQYSLLGFNEEYLEPSTQKTTLDEAKAQINQESSDEQTPLDKPLDS